MTKNRTGTTSSHPETLLPTPLCQSSHQRSVSKTAAMSSIITALTRSSKEKVLEFFISMLVAQMAPQKIADDFKASGTTYSVALPLQAPAFYRLRRAW